jgi:hypothetical protein
MVDRTLTVMIAALLLCVSRAEDPFFNLIDEHELDMPTSDKHASECALILNGATQYSNEYSQFGTDR